MRRFWLLFGCVLAACSREPSGAAPTATTSASSPPIASGAPVTPWQLDSLPFFPELRTPPANPLTAEKIALGRTLFFDKRLGAEHACSSCHKPDRGWADGLALSKRASGRMNARHTPSLYNVGYQRYWGWDGRSPTLEARVAAEWAGQLAATPEVATKRIAEDAGYDPLFNAAFGDHQITKERIVHAIASFVRSIRNGDAPYDRFEAGDAAAIGEDAKRGWLVFRDKAGCTACHVPPLFTDNSFHNVGVGYDRTGDVDVGRFELTQRKRETGAFKTPSLRGAAHTAPYFHDGSAATLEAAVDYMLSGGHDNPQRDQGLTKIELTAEQRADLLAFIRSLDGRRP